MREAFGEGAQLLGSQEDRENMRQDGQDNRVEDEEPERKHVEEKE